MSEIKRVTGLGGVFFKTQNPDQIKEWYNKHLGIDAGPYGATFEWRQKDDPEKPGTTAWNPFKETTQYFSPSEKSFMINYRVDDLEKLLEALRSEGVEIVGDMQAEVYGKFAWIMDPEGNKIELWEPVDEKL
jgi:predicted enzyme related to lactoylglutathione lyase